MDIEDKNNSFSIKRLLIGLIVCDIVFILLHFIFGLNYTLFNIDAESNLPTLYQGGKLLTFGYFFLFSKNLFNIKNVKEKLIWFSASALFIFLGLDEIGQIHENIPIYADQIFTNSYGIEEYLRNLFGYNGANWVFFYVPIIVLVGLPLSIIHFKYLVKTLKSKIFLFVIGFLFLFSIPVIEILNSAGDLSYEVYNYSIAMEELFEKLGVTFVGISYLYMYLFKLKTSGSK